MSIKLGDGVNTEFWEDGWSVGGSFRRTPRGGVEQHQFIEMSKFVKLISLVPSDSNDHDYEIPRNAQQQVLDDLDEPVPKGKLNQLPDAKDKQIMIVIFEFLNDYDVFVDKLRKNFQATIPGDMSPGNICHRGTDYLTEKYVGPTFSLGIVAVEHSPANIPQRQVTGETFLRRQVAGESPEMSLGNVVNVVLNLILAGRCSSLNMKLTIHVESL
nr:hypothetical protein [Tanacetum cinerariifolium]